MSHDRICTSNASVVRINGNIIPVGVLPDACYRLSVQQIHLRYKSYRTMCCITNLDPKMDACKSTRPKTCRNTTFTWLERARPSTKSRAIIGAQCTGSYPTRVTVCPYNGYIRGTNPITRHVMSLTYTPTRMRANQRAPKHTITQPLQDLHGSTVRARPPNLVTF